MKLTVSTSQLAGALKRASRCVGNGRTGHPILACVLLTATDGSLTIAGFDLQTGISLRIPASTDTPGAVAINAQMLTDLVSALPSDLPLSLEQATAGDQVLLCCGSSSYRVASQHADDYPELPTPQASDTTCSVNSAAFLDACHHARSVASSDESKGVLCGLNLRCNPAGGYQVAATDGHRLIQFGSITDHTAEATIPARTIQQLERFEVVDAITVVFGSGVVHFLAGDGQSLCGRTLDGTYPNYGQLFPSDFTGEMTINRRQLRDAVLRAAIIARNSNDVLRIRPSQDDGTIVVCADNDTGAASETIALESCSDPCNFAINADYLREALEPFGHEQVVFHLVGPTQPIVLEPSDPDAQVQPVRSLIMPVQVRSETPAKPDKASKRGKVAQ